MFSWLKRRRRHSLLQQPFPAAWEAILQQNLTHYRRLTPEEQRKLRDDARILIAEKNWEGCGGLAITDEIKLTIAAEASRLLLGFQEEYFDHVQSILVYPDAYTAPDQVLTPGGMELRGDEDRAGEAWYRGPVILSWADALAGAKGEREGESVVLHEFAHQLDMQNGHELDGTPWLASREQYRCWTEVLNAELRRLEEDCRRGRPTLLDCYGATDRAEFFAVATECFFQRPRALAARHAELYAQLRSFYRQDPAARE